MTHPNQVYVWGSDKTGGLGGKGDEKLPKVVERLNEANISSVVCGPQFNAAYSEENEQLYLWGKCGDMLEDSFSATVALPKAVTFPNGKTKLRSIGCSNSVIIVVTDSGQVYSWGKDTTDLPLLGWRGRNSETPVLIEWFKSLPIKQVACGYSHACALSENGRVFSWGAGGYGRLGLGATNTSCIFPTEIKTLSNQEIISVSCGKTHSLALTVKGLVYSWGSGEYFCLGHGNDNNYDSPTLIKDDVMKGVVQIASGWHHNLALTETNELFAWGWSCSGQCGHALFDQKRPIKVALKHVVKISCGALTSYAINKDGVLYAWGAGDSYQCGLGHPTNEWKPKYVKSLKGKTVIDVAGGQYHCVAVVKDSGDAGVESSDEDQSDGEEYTVEAILDKQRGENGLVEYRVRWKNYEGQDTWEPVAHLNNCQKMIDDFERSWVPHSKDSVRGYAPVAESLKMKKVKQQAKANSFKPSKPIPSTVKSSGSKPSAMSSSSSSKISKPSTTTSTTTTSSTLPPIIDPAEFDIDIGSHFPFMNEDNTSKQKETEAPENAQILKQIEELEVKLAETKTLLQMFSEAGVQPETEAMFLKLTEKEKSLASTLQSYLDNPTISALRKSSTPKTPSVNNEKQKNKDTAKPTPTTPTTKKPIAKITPKPTPKTITKDQPQQLIIKPKATKQDEPASKTLEKESLEKEKTEKAKMEKERLQKELELERLENERMEKERIQREKLEEERLEKERLEKERLEKERLEKERLEKERLEKERLEKERLEKERLEKERLEKERLEKERLEKERLEKERLEKERLERLEKERLEKERLEKERLEKERQEKERQEKERQEKERLKKVKQEKERLEKERLEQERLEQERLAKERLEKERLEQERAEKKRLEKQLEKERVEKERLEQEKKEKERKAKLKKERLEKERLEKERLETERLEKERLEKKRLKTERLEKERLEQEQKEKEQVEQERLEKEKVKEEKKERKPAFATLSSEPTYDYLKENPKLVHSARHCIMDQQRQLHKWQQMKIRERQLMDVKKEEEEESVKVEAKEIATNGTKRTKEQEGKEDTKKRKRKENDEAKAKESVRKTKKEKEEEKKQKEEKQKQDKEKGKEKEKKKEKEKEKEKEEHDEVEVVVEIAKQEDSLRKREVARKRKHDKKQNRDEENEKEEKDEIKEEEEKEEEDKRSKTKGRTVMTPKSKRKAQEKGEEEKPKKKRKYTKKKKEEEEEEEEEEKEEERKEYTVEKVLDKKITEEGTFYFIKWEGWGPEFNNWEPAENLNCPDLIKDYELQNSPKPKPAKFKRIDYSIAPTVQEGPTLKTEKGMTYHEYFTKDEDGENLTEVAQIKELYITPDKQKWAEIRWFYTPEQIAGGRKSHHFPNELFESSHFDALPFSSVIRKVEVTKTNSKNAKNLNKEKDSLHYICRFTYNVKDKSFVPIKTP